MNDATHLRSIAADEFMIVPRMVPAPMHQAMGYVGPLAGLNHLRMVIGAYALYRRAGAEWELVAEAANQADLAAIMTAKTAA